ncbi:hypothetical protein E3T39_00410 [Cryobacterium suzukii]|uniref:SRPBCC family protein n=1 Tax=Cryobacterium suzukii TaxID=1259198 RepID=A0A4V3IT20_9MICO|nr:SRPBCC family protein [Cryobacterium suzukii]TFD63208.1 hypothetical protein E3T39_00410 [Cryobacterium suzukii]
MEHTGSRMIKAASTTIANILADIRRLPEWNPAILSVTTDDSTAVVEKKYSVRAKLPGSTTIAYDAVSRDQIIWRLDGFHAHETGTWKLVPVNDQMTEVTHAITHSGAVFLVLAGAFQSVPGLRLDRLQRRAEDGE